MDKFADCYVSLEESVLRIGNAGIARTWELKDGSPAVVSIVDSARDRDWVVEAPYRDSFRRCELPLTGPLEVAVTADKDDFCGVSAEHLKVTVTLSYSDATLVWTQRVWPELPIILAQFDIEKHGAPGSSIEPEAFFDSGDMHLRPIDDRLDFFRVKPLHLTYHATTFVAQSDYHDNLVVENSGFTFPKEHVRGRGNFFHLCDRETPGGLLAVKIAPPPDEQLQYRGCDFYFSGKTLSIVGTGVSTEELESGGNFSSYIYGIGVTDGCEQSGVELFYELDKRRIKPNPKKNFSILANSWGDMQQHQELGEELVFAEVRAGAALGLTHVQMDAGWHKGNAMILGVEENRPNSAYSYAEDFWGLHEERFPHGLKPVVDIAEEEGVGLGIWFNPDGTNDCAHWQDDRDVVLGLWKDYGFQNIKIDGVSVYSKTGEANLLAFFKGVHDGSNGQVCLNFDITGGGSWRPGHFYGNEFTGNLFIENRYTTSGTYYPHRTLRNLWHLAKYMPTYRLQMEFLNPRMNTESYAADDPFSPQAFGAEYACAATLFANPLCWMYVSRLAPEDSECLSKLINAYRPHQEAILCGRVRPIGEEPSGRSWTGLQSVTEAGSGYLIVYRECTDRDRGEFVLKGVEQGTVLTLEKIAGTSPDTQLAVDKDCCVQISLPEPRSYALFKYKVG